jgi:hypothetical protein
LCGAGKPGTKFDCPIQVCNTVWFSYASDFAPGVMFRSEGSKHVMITSNFDVTNKNKYPAALQHWFNLVYSNRT